MSESDKAGEGRVQGLPAGSPRQSRLAVTMGEGLSLTHPKFAFEIDLGKLISLQLSTFPTSCLHSFSRAAIHREVRDIVLIVAIPHVVHGSIASLRAIRDTDGLSRNDCISNGIAGVSSQGSKRKAVALDDNGMNGPRDSLREELDQGLSSAEGSVRADNARSVCGVHYTGPSLEGRLLGVLQTLGRRHHLLVEDRVMDFVMHHEDRSRRDPLPLYVYKAPSDKDNEVDLQIAQIENEIHYCLDLYHTAKESYGLGTGQLPTSRDGTWYDRKAQERFKRRKAE
ncbi:hypothetical protein B0O80DRAFT_527530 [Mortierella sp. GBAus27b]|nr:hypothetical protein B0O80DRAFT_527530 [Mortierella sp. GBAus27b]